MPLAPRATRTALHLLRLTEDFSLDHVNTRSLLCQRGALNE